MKPSRVSHNLMHITDWVPTLLAAAGKTDGKRQGKNGWLILRLMEKGV